MVSYNVYKATSSGAYVEGVCLASDEKPVVGIANGSILFAVDASSGETTRYMYDKSAMAWIEAECPCSGGSGGGGEGGGGGLEPLIVTATMSHSGVTVDKTYAEIVAAVEAGRVVYARAGDDTNGWSVLPFSGYRSANGSMATPIPGEVHFSDTWVRGDGVLTILSLTIDDIDATDMGMYTTGNS